MWDRRGVGLLIARIDELEIHVSLGSWDLLGRAGTSSQVSSALSQCLSIVLRAQVAKCLVVQDKGKGWVWTHSANTRGHPMKDAQPPALPSPEVVWGWE